AIQQSKPSTNELAAVTSKPATALRRGSIKVNTTTKLEPSVVQTDKQQRRSSITAKVQIDKPNIPVPVIPPLASKLAQIKHSQPISHVTQTKTKTVNNDGSSSDTVQPLT